jgi:RecG-like helicase
MKVSTRLNALKKSQNGRELSELDLKLRGPGEVFGLKQSGFLSLRREAGVTLSLSSKLGRP